MLSNPEFRKMAETLTGRKLASDVVGASEPDQELLAFGQEQLKKAFLDDASKQISDWWGRRAPDTQNALRGAGIGAGIGAATGLMTGRRRPFRDAVLGGVLGGGLGGIVGGVGSSVAQKWKGDKDVEARKGLGVMNRASKIGQGTLDKVERYFPDVGGKTDPTTTTAVGWGGIGAAGGMAYGALGRANGVGLRASMFRLPTFVGGGMGAGLGALRESKNMLPGFSKDKVPDEEFVTGANQLGAVLTDEVLKQQHANILRQVQAGTMAKNTAGDEIAKLFGQQQINNANKLQKGSSVLKQAGTWDDVKAWGSGMADKAQAYWTLGKGELEKNPELQRGLYGAGIGAAAGGLLGATNRKRRGTSMLAGILGGGLLGAGGGMLSSRLGISSGTTSPPAASPAAAATVPSPTVYTPEQIQKVRALRGFAEGDPDPTAAQMQLSLDREQNNTNFNRGAMRYGGAAAGGIVGSALGPIAVNVAAGKNRELRATNRQLGSLNPEMFGTEAAKTLKNRQAELTAMKADPRRIFLNNRWGASNLLGGWAGTMGGLYGGAQAGKAVYGEPQPK